MSQAIPLIRASAIAPMRRWLDEKNRNTEAFLAEADLNWVPDDDPMLPIPLRNAAFLLRSIARAEGPDAPYRIVGSRGGFELGLIGAEALCAPTLREAFHRVTRGMQSHCTHEVFTASNGANGLHISDGWMVSLGDDEMQHLVQQYFTAMVDMICSVAAGPPPCITRVGIVPHPETGLAHLNSWLGERVYENGRRLLDLEISNEIADLEIPAKVREQMAEFVENEPLPLPKFKTLTEYVAFLVETMLPKTKPTIGRLAFASGLSQRTLQRRLKYEGVSFSQIVDSARARIALSRLKHPDRPALNQLAKELGYSDQATLTRAVQRWEGKIPSDIR